MDDKTYPAYVVDMLRDNVMKLQIEVRQKDEEIDRLTALASKWRWRALGGIRWWRFVFGRWAD